MMKKGFLVAAMMCVLSVATVMCVHAEEPKTEAAATLYTYDFTKGYLSRETMNISSTVNNFMFMLATELNVGIKNISGEIGLAKENTEKDQKIELVVSPVGDCKNLDEVKAFIEEKAPGTVVTPTKINEYDTLVYGSQETNSMCVLIGAGDAGFLRVICHPVNDPQMAKLFSYVAASIQTIK